MIAPARPRAGFSLVEALISLAVLGVLMMLALPLVIESLRLLEDTGRRALYDNRDSAQARLRNDLEAATATNLTGDGRWREQSLILGRGLVRIEWRHQGGELWRIQQDPGEPVSRRRELAAVEQFWVRSLGGIVEIDIRGRGAPRPAVTAITGPVVNRRPEAPWREQLVVARKSGRQGAW